MSTNKLKEKNINIFGALFYYMLAIKISHSDEPLVRAVHPIGWMIILIAYAVATIIPFFSEYTIKYTWWMVSDGICFY